MFTVPREWKTAWTLALIASLVGLLPQIHLTRCATKMVRPAALVVKIAKTRKDRVCERTINMLGFGHACIGRHGLLFQEHLWRGAMSALAECACATALRACSSFIYFLSFHFSLNICIIKTIRYQPCVSGDCQDPVTNLCRIECGVCAHCKLPFEPRPTTRQLRY